MRQGTLQLILLRGVFLFPCHLRVWYLLISTQPRPLHAHIRQCRSERTKPALEKLLYVTCDLP